MTGSSPENGLPRSPDQGSGENLGVSGSHHRQLTPAETAAMEEKIRKIEIAISLVLRIGVTVSVVVISAGLGLMFAHHGDYTSFNGRFSYKALTSRSSSFPHSLGSVIHSIARGDGKGVVVLGIFLLILTPILRVAVGVLSFMYEKDLPMTIVTLYVLAVLVGSFLLAGV